MNKPHIPQTSPIVVTLKAGQIYWWCSCGHSKTQPFCDGSHAGTDFTPLKLESKTDERVYLCACKLTATKPYCDGAHKRLREKSL